jgi:RHS repeat-associated protein
MEMAGRGFSGSYRFGYQGSEKDNEVSGDGNSYTTEFRQLDPRLGRWFSVDPVFQPWQSPYTSMDNNPIGLNDPLGLSTKGKNPNWLTKMWNKLTGKTSAGIEKVDRQKKKATEAENKDVKAKKKEEDKKTEDKEKEEEKKKKEEEKKEDEDNSGFAILIAAPDATAKVNQHNKKLTWLFGDKDLPVDHAGVIIVDKDGHTKYFDFGRFDDRGDMTREKNSGEVRSSKNVPALRLPDAKMVDGKITEESMKEILGALGRSSAIDGHGYKRLTASVYSGLNYKKMLSFAQGQEARKSIFFGGYFENSSDKSYCAKFARQVVNAGGGHFLPNTWTGGNNVWSTSVINGSHIYEYKNGTVK